MGLESRSLIYGSFICRVVSLKSHFHFFGQATIFSLFCHILSFFFGSILELLSRIFFYINDGIFGASTHVWK